VTGDPPAPAPPPRLGNLVGGALLIVLGVLWLLDVLDVITISWQQLLAAALVVVGAGLVWGSRTAHHGGLIAFGIILTVAVMFASTVEVLADIRFGGGVGERVIGPDDVDGRRLAVGSLTVDLRGGDLSGVVEASVAIGELVVIVDDPAAVTVEARAGIGEVVVFDRRAAGLGPDLRVESTDPEFRLVVSVGIGKVEVRS
jgi:hypothetical protein